MAVDVPSNYRPASGAENDLMNRVRDALILATENHHASCTDPNCAYIPNVLAFVAHCIGARKEDLQRFPALLVEYDLHCKKNGGCEACNEEGECSSCRGYGYFDDDGRASIDRRGRQCGDCRGTGRSHNG